MSNFEIYLILFLRKRNFLRSVHVVFILEFCFLLFIKFLTATSAWKVLQVNLKKLQISQINESAQKFYCVIFGENLGTESDGDVWLCLFKRVLINFQKFILNRCVEINVWKRASNKSSIHPSGKMRNFLLIKTHIIHLHFIEIWKLFLNSLSIPPQLSLSRHEKLI